MTFSRLVVHVALLALASGIVGLLCGRYLWPRCPRSHPPSARPAAPHDLEPALSDLEERLLASEAQLRQLRLAVAQVSDDQGDGPPAPAAPASS